MGDDITSKYVVVADETVPAARVIIAKTLVGKHKLSESEVAKRLGVAQAAVSKYVNGKYSPKITKRMKSIERNLGKNKGTIDSYIEKIAEGHNEYVPVCICTICVLEKDIHCIFSYVKNAGKLQ